MAAAPADPGAAMDEAPLGARPTYEPSVEDEPARRTKGKRHSTGMMAGGIVMVSFVPIALLVSLVANAQQTACEAGDYYFDSSGSFQSSYSSCDEYDPTIYGGVIAAVALLGAGIPMIVIGGKREPAVARVSPWASPQAAGLKLSLDL
jgi:hypothetical protein